MWALVQIATSRGSTRESAKGSGWEEVHGLRAFALFAWDCSDAPLYTGTSRVEREGGRNNPTGVRASRVSFSVGVTIRPHAGISDPSPNTGPIHSVAVDQRHDTFCEIQALPPVDHEGVQAERSLDLDRVPDILDEDIHKILVETVGPDR